MRRKIDPRILVVLERAGVTWELVSRRRHNQLVVEGTVVLTLTRGRGIADHGAQTDNALAAVKRFLKRREQC